MNTKQVLVSQNFLNNTMAPKILILHFNDFYFSSNTTLCLSYGIIEIQTYNYKFLYEATAETKKNAKNVLRTPKLSLLNNFLACTVSDFYFFGEKIFGCIRYRFSQKIEPTAFYILTTSNSVLQTSAKLVLKQLHMWDGSLTWAKTWFKDIRF